MKSARYLFVSFLFPCVCFAQTLEEALSYGLPVVVVNTVNGEEPTAERIDPPEGCLGVGITNATKVPGRVKIFLPGDAENPAFDSGDYAENESGMLFKIRGNTSALNNKKPFKIKLQKKADLLMRGDKKYNDKDWALIRPTASSRYPCPISTMVGCKVTELFRVTDWVPANICVNLIVNGNYRGFYVLIESVKRNENCRIDVDEETGYIAEVDPYWWNEDVYVESSLLQRTTLQQYRFTFKYPDSKDITEGQLAAFKAYIDLLDASITKGTYPLYINVESCARWLLAHQLLGTLDAAGSNIFFIKRDDQSPLQMATLWDFDSLFGIQGRFTSIMMVHYFGQMLKTSPNKLLAREMQRLWQEEKEHIMDEAASFCNSLSDEELAKAIDNSTRADKKRWPACIMDDMETATNKLREWFPTRAEEIDSLLHTLDTTDGYIDWDAWNAWYDGITFVECENDKTKTRKVIRNGHLYIIKDGNTYSPDGKKIK